jgi:hypothetical protein
VTRVRMVFIVLPHDPMACPRCGTMLTAWESTCSTCYPKESAK